MAPSAPSSDRASSRWSGLYVDAAAAPPARPRCRIRAVSAAEASGIRLHPDHTPCRWPEHQFATELHLDEALGRSQVRARWTTSEASEADLIMLTEHRLSLWCVREHAVSHDLLKSPDARTRARGRACQAATAAGGPPPERALVTFPPAVRAPAPSSTPLPASSNPAAKAEMWARLLSHSVLRAAANRSLPVVIALTNNECTPPWGLAPPPPNLLLLHAQGRGRRRHDVIVPLSLASPAWLVGRAPPPPLPAWRERRLLFFAGHVPKLYISKTRYRLWKALRVAHDAKLITATIEITVGSYDV